jgi:hypothetical protein
MMVDHASQPRHVLQRLETAPRWLLPFTHGVERSAIERVVSLAASAGATLVAVSLISSPAKGARLEHIQQSKDFLETVLHTAARFQVLVERFEVFTAGALQQDLVMLVHERRCEAIVVVTDGGHARLLQDEQVKRLLVEPPAALVLLRLAPPSDLPTAWPLARLLSWWRGLRGRQNTATAEEAITSAVEPQRRASSKRNEHEFTCE